MDTCTRIQLRRKDVTSHAQDRVTIELEFFIMHTAAVVVTRVVGCIDTLYMLLYAVWSICVGW